MISMSSDPNGSFRSFEIFPPILPLVIALKIDPNRFPPSRLNRCYCIGDVSELQVACSGSALCLRGGSRVQGVRDLGWRWQPSYPPRVSDGQRHCSSHISYLSSSFLDDSTSRMSTILDMILQTEGKVCSSVVCVREYKTPFPINFLLLSFATYISQSIFWTNLVCSSCYYFASTVQVESASPLR